MPQPPLSPRYRFFVRLSAWVVFVWEKVLPQRWLRRKTKKKIHCILVLEGHNSEYMAVWHCWRGIFQSPLWCVSTSHGQSLTPPLSNRSPYIVVIVKRMLSAMKLKARVTYIAVPLFSDAKSAFTFSCVTIYDPSVHFVPLSIIHLNPIQPLPSTRQPWITKTISLKNYKW